MTPAVNYHKAFEFQSKTRPPSPKQKHSCPLDNNSEEHAHPIAKLTRVEGERRWPIIAHQYENELMNGRTVSAQKGVKGYTSVFSKRSRWYHLWNLWNYPLFVHLETPYFLTVKHCHTQRRTRATGPQNGHIWSSCKYIFAQLLLFRCLTMYVDRITCSR